MLRAMRALKRPCIRVFLPTTIVALSTLVVVFLAQAHSALFSKKNPNIAHTRAVQSLEQATTE